VIVSAHSTRPQPASRTSLRIRFTSIESRWGACRLGLFVSTMLWALVALPCCVAAVDEPVHFGLQIRPILSDKCFTCHGPNEADRQGGFRLDQKDSALGEADSGAHPIVPGDPKTSEILQRITADDEDMRMPPAETNKTLSPEEIKTIREWIKQGAPWERHWAYIPPRQAPLPKVQHTQWPRNEVDRFVLARLEHRGMAPAPMADKITLIRRVTFDLTGLPPTLDEVRAFLDDTAPNAYERIVDRLLASPRYGEHMARFWLDAARYGDTHGLHLDNYREMWPYRDWVVRAFNRNLPFDRFIIEQLAGDLLPNPTDDQLIATGFNRCHVTTSEGGSIDEEVYVRNVMDRVETTGIVFLGATIGCTRCHDHKYDPYTMKDYYSLFAYFNNLDGPALDGNKQDPPPILRVMSDKEKSSIAKLKKQVEGLNTTIKTRLAAIDYCAPADDAKGKETVDVEQVWFDDELPVGAQPEGGWQWVTAPKPVFSGKRASTRTSTGLSQHFFTGAKDPLVIDRDQVFFAYVYLDAENPPKEIMMQWNDGSWEHRAYWGGNEIDWGKDKTASRKRLGDLPPAGKWTRLEIPAAQVGLKPGAKLNGWALTQYDGTVYWDKAGVTRRDVTYRSLAAWEKDQAKEGGKALPKPIQTALKKAPAKRTEAETGRLRDYFLEYVFVDTRGEFQKLHETIKRTEQKISAIEKAAPTTLIFREKKTPRPAYVLDRGEYDQRKDEVPRAVPAALPPLPDGVPNNRLGLAMWLVDESNPLTARVTVNRLWQQVFGVGLVKTAEDFGSQGEVPSHPLLLDWLAVQFARDGWNVKKTMKRIVMSATYRQTSSVPTEQYEQDRENRLLARGPRFRLDAEMLRDQALMVGGLLVEKLGGPSVKPPQPDGLWFAVGYSGSNTVRFKADTGPDKVHRRTLYTFIKRTSPPPQLTTFDAPSRESCTVRRERTNTPLQALLMMNDPQYFECALGLAQRVLRTANPTPKNRALQTYRLATSRTANDEQLEELLSAYHDFIKAYRNDGDAATKVIHVAGTQPDEKLDPAELAAWTMVGNLVLNLDEVITK